MKQMPSVMERIYAELLDREYQKGLFGDLPGFQRKGNASIAQCPFHADTLPTFVIQSDRPEYFCFVCSRRGDWLKYLQARQRISFQEALGRLAESAGIVPDSYDESGWKEELDRADLLETAMSFFITHLWNEQGAEVLRYLYSRGYSMGEVEGMALGCYSPRLQTKEFLLSQGFAQRQIERILSGLWQQAGDDPFLVIPFRDAAGRLLGLIRRTVRSSVDDAYAPLTDMKMLSDVPFNMYRSRRRSEIIVVEGYFDALLLDQIRLKPVIAIGKGGLTEGFIKAAAAYGARHFTLALGNGAQRTKATLASIELIREKGFGVSVLPIPRRYEDLDQYIRLTCLDHFKALMDKEMSADQWMAKRKK
jgi:DNA primase